MWTFDQPWALVVIALLPPAIWLRHFWPWRAGVWPFSFAVAGGKQFRPPVSAWRWLQLVSHWLFWLGVVCLIVAIAGPVGISRSPVYLSQGQQIMLVVDVSPSMAAQDSPGISRLAKAVETVAQFIRRQTDAAIGLVAFGSDASLECPLTQDYQVLIRRLQKLRPGMLGDGTSLGLGLALARLHVDSGAAAKQNRIVILISDGDNNNADINPAVAITLLKDAAIRAYTVGIGSDREAYLEYADQVTGRRISGTFKGLLGESLLQAVADQTGGKYFFVGTGDTLTAAIANIVGAEPVRHHLRIEFRRTKLSGWFLIIAISLVGIDLLLRRLILRDLS